MTSLPVIPPMAAMSFQSEVEPDPQRAAAELQSSDIPKAPHLLTDSTDADINDKESEEKHPLDIESRRALSEDSDRKHDSPYATQFDKEGNPIITTGHDVARHLMSDRDDHDPALTFRGFVLGTSLAIFSNLLSALFSAKPTSVGLGTLFSMLILLVFGNIWAKFFPKPSWVEGRPKLQWLEKPLRVFNPGPFRLKEHFVALTMADMGALTGWATDTLTVSKLFFDVGIKPVTAILGIFSITTMGIGLVGVLSPMIVAPSEIVYWAGLPTLITIQAIHWDVEGNKRRLRIFGWAMAGSFCWEIFPAWVMPWLNGISVPCMASMHASHSVRKTLSRIFGGALPNQGLGFLSISLDTQYVSFGQFSGYPLKWQIQYFSGSIVGAFILLGLYYSNAWNAKSLPFMTPTLYRADGTVYDQLQVFDHGFQVNTTALNEYGYPHMSVSEVFSFFTTALGLGGLVTHTILFLGKEVVSDFRAFHSGTLDDRHWQAIRRNYKAVPEWIYYLLSALALIAAFVVIYAAETTLSWWGLVVALMLGTVMTPISLSIYGRYGSAVPTMMVSKTIAGAIRPGRPLANLWFCQFSHQVTEVSGTIAGNLKAGQFLKIPPRINVAAQLWGTLLGAYLSWLMMSIVIRREHDILLDPVGNNQWYGGYYQSLNSQAVEWSLAYKVFSIHGGLKYEWIPLGFLLGALLPCIHWVAKNHIKIIRDAGQNIATPIFCYYLSNLGGGVNSPFTSCMIVALVSQVWLRVKKPKLFAELNYIVAAAIDGGVSIMIFILTFAVMGAAGRYTAFPTWWGNPDPPEAPDHCLAPRG